MILVNQGCAEKNGDGKGLPGIVVEGCPPKVAEDGTVGRSSAVFCSPFPDELDAAVNDSGYSIRASVLLASTEAVWKLWFEAAIVLRSASAAARTAS
jgi:hypothetical protein